MAAEEIEKIQKSLDEAFARFAQENPELAEAMRVLNISYEQYLSIQPGLRQEPETITGNTQPIPGLTI